MMTVFIALGCGFVGGAIEALLLGARQAAVGDLFLAAGCFVASAVLE